MSENFAPSLIARPLMGEAGDDTASMTNFQSVMLLRPSWPSGHFSRGCLSKDLKEVMGAELIRWVVPIRFLLQSLSWRVSIRTIHAHMQTYIDALSWRQEVGVRVQSAPQLRNTLILTRVLHYPRKSIIQCLTYAILAILYRTFQGPRGARYLKLFSCAMSLTVIARGAPHTHGMLQVVCAYQS